jgi:hypothetical protein
VRRRRTSARGCATVWSASNRSSTASPTSAGGRPRRGAAPPGFPGDAAFELHDTFGFPIDLTAEIAEDAGLPLDRDAFDELMEAQRQRARAGAKKGGGGVPVETYREAAGLVGTTDFVGYDGWSPRRNSARSSPPAGCCRPPARATR